jgi:hypothetical protein
MHSCAWGYRGLTAIDVKGGLKGTRESGEIEEERLIRREAARGFRIGVGRSNERGHAMAREQRGELPPIVCLSKLGVCEPENNLNQAEREGIRKTTPSCQRQDRVARKGKVASVGEEKRSIECNYLRRATKRVKEGNTAGERDESAWPTSRSRRGGSGRPSFKAESLRERGREESVSNESIKARCACMANDGRMQARRV